MNGSQDQRAAEWKARLVEGRVIFGVKGGAAVVEPSRQAQDEWVRIIRETSITDLKFWRECTPGYYNSEGEEVFRSHLGEPYGPGFYAFDRLLQQWRAKGEMEGLILDRPGGGPPLCGGVIQGHLSPNFPNSRVPC